MSFSNELISFVASVGGASGITILLIKVLGNKMLQTQFEKSLENYKFRINSKFDRISKIHEKEFEMLPIVWNAIIDTNSKFYKLTSHFQQYPDLNKMSDLEIDELFERKKMKPSEIDRIKKASDKMKEYIEIDYWKKLSAINEAMQSFDHIYQSNKIFFVKEFEENMDNIRKIFIEMFSILETANDDGRIDYKFKATANKKQDEIDPYINNIGKLIQKRLCFDEAY